MVLGSAGAPFAFLTFLGSPEIIHLFTCWSVILPCSAIVLPLLLPCLAFLLAYSVASSSSGVYCTLSIYRTRGMITISGQVFVVCNGSFLIHKPFLFRDTLYPPVYVPLGLWFLEGAEIHKWTKSTLSGYNLFCSVWFLCVSA